MKILGNQSKIHCEVNLNFTLPWGEGVSSSLCRTLEARLRKLLTIWCIFSLNMCSLSGFSMELFTVDSILWAKDGEVDLKRKY